MRTPYCVMHCVCVCVCVCVREREREREREHMCHKIDFLLVIVLNIRIGKTAE